MAFFDDMASALQNYPATNVTIEIVELTVPGSALNVGETGSFKLKVTNNGPLDMINAVVRVRGLNGVTVKGRGAAEPFGPDGLSDAMLVPAHGGSAVSAGNMSCKAPATAQPRKELLRATLDQWDAGLEHLLINHSVASKDVVASYSAAVLDS